MQRQPKLELLSLHAAVLGAPIAHSMSPLLHRAAYRELGLDWDYSAVETQEPQLPMRLAALDTSWAGLSLTMPLKRAVVPLLDEVEPLAAALGVVNTVLVQAVGSGRLLVGANTDVHGIAKALAGAGYGGTEHGVIVGGGGTAASALAALVQGGTRRVSVIVRSRSRAGFLLRLAAHMDVELDLRSTSNAGRPALGDAGVCVSTIPVSGQGAITRYLAESGMVPRGHHLLDVIYEPHPTLLSTWWSGAGGAVATGFEMLLWQACEQVRLMTGMPAPELAMRRALDDAIGSR